MNYIDKQEDCSIVDHGRLVFFQSSASEATKLSDTANSQQMPYWKRSGTKNITEKKLFMKVSLVFLTFHCRENDKLQFHQEDLFKGFLKSAADWALRTYSL